MSGWFSWMLGKQHADDTQHADDNKFDDESFQDCAQADEDQVTEQQSIQSDDGNTEIVQTDHPSYSSWKRRKQHGNKPNERQLSIHSFRSNSCAQILQKQNPINSTAASMAVSKALREESNRKRKREKMREQRIAGKQPAVSITSSKPRNRNKSRGQANDSGNRFEMRTQSTLCAEVDVVLPHGQGLYIRNINPFLLYLLHNELVDESVKGKLEECSRVVKRADRDETAKEVMMHWSQSSASASNKISMEEAILQSVNVKQTNLFNSSTNQLLFNFSLYVEEALKDHFPSMRDEETKLRSTANVSSSSGQGQVPLQENQAAMLEVPVNLMTCLFGLQTTLLAKDDVLHTDSAGSLEHAFDLWQKGQLAQDSWMVGYKLFVPLFKEGLVLRVLSHEKQSECPNPKDFKSMQLKAVRVDFGGALLLRADVAHSGDYGSPGNVSISGGLFCNFKEHHDLNKYPIKRQDMNYKEDDSTKLKPKDIFKGAELLVKGYRSYEKEYVTRHFPYDPEYLWGVYPQFHGEFV